MEKQSNTHSLSQNIQNILFFSEYLYYIHIILNMADDFNTSLEKYCLLAVQLCRNLLQNEDEAREAAQEVVDIFVKTEEPPFDPLVLLNTIARKVCWKRLYGKDYFSMIFKYCRKRLRNKEEAEEIAQDVFIKYIKTMEKRPVIISNLSGYLKMIAKNMCNNLDRAEERKRMLIYAVATDIPTRRLRVEKEESKGRKNNFSFSDPLYRPSWGNDFSFEKDMSFVNGRNEQLDEIQTYLLDLLGAKSKNILLLDICHDHYFGKMSFEEIAENKGISSLELKKKWEERDIFFMYFYDGMSLDKIAKKKNMSTAGVHKRIETLIRQFRLKMEDDKK
jgi:RNA polymerase sigma factor (sigma-70 family)